MKFTHTHTHTHTEKERATKKKTKKKRREEKRQKRNQTSVSQFFSSWGLERFKSRTVNSSENGRSAVQGRGNGSIARKRETWKKNAFCRRLCSTFFFLGGRSVFLSALHSAPLLCRYVSEIECYVFPVLRHRSLYTLTGSAFSPPLSLSLFRQANALS